MMGVLWQKLRVLGQPALARAAQHWLRLSAREQSLLRGAALLLALAFFWWVALSPALRILASADAERDRLTQQWQKLQSAAQEAARLRPSAAATGPEQTEALRRIGEAIFASAPQMLDTPNQRERIAQFTLRALPAARLAEGIAALRLNAHARLLGADLRRAPAGAQAAGVLWNGTLTVAITLQ